MPGVAESGQDQPQPPDRQIDNEIVVAQVGRAIAGTFGGEYHHQAGGGGAGGYYEFTSLAELDGVITRLKAVRDRIGADGIKFQQAIGLAQPPASDIMSVMQADATRSSLQAGYLHNQALLREAEASMAKLEAGRAKYAEVERGTTTNLNRQHRD